MKLNSPKVFKNQKGVILLLSLFMMAMIEVIVIFVLMKYRHVIYGATNFNASVQAVTYAKGVEDQLINRLLKIKGVKDKDKMIPFDKLNLNMEFNGGYAQSELADAQGKFNLNNLTDEDAMNNFVNMLGALSDSTKSDIDKSLLPFIQERVKYYSVPKTEAAQEVSDNWEDTATKEAMRQVMNQSQAVAPNIKQGADNTPSNVQQKTGKAQKPNKPVGEVPFGALSEIMVLPDMTHNIYQKLQNDLTALPEVTPLSVNAATANALMALNPKINIKIAETIILTRKQMGGFPDIGSFTKIMTDEKIQITDEQVTIDSHYYLATIYVKYRNVQMTLFSLLKVNGGENAATVKVVWRSINTL
jgi:type II secretory pathway component PulK